MRISPRELETTLAQETFALTEAHQTNNPLGVHNEQLWSLSDTPPFQTVKCCEMLGKRVELFSYLKKKNGGGGEGEEGGRGSGGERRGREREGEGERGRGALGSGKSSQALVLRRASPTRTNAEAQALAEPGCESGRQQMEREIANTSVFTGACCSLY